MARAPALTVVIPHLDAPDALARCLTALAAQRSATNPFEVIVVDNGSAMRPEAECAAHPFVRLIDEPVPGPGPARNRGARLAGTGLLAFIDCDCIAQPGWVDAIVAYFATHPDTGVIGGDVRIARADPGRLTAIEAYESVYGYRMRLYVERDHYTATCNMALRREIFGRVGGFGGIEIAEDVDWGRRATALGVRIDYVPQMRIETPARKDFGELRRKWDRHIGHDFEKVSGPGGRLRWGMRALALAASPLAEIVRIARSDRICGWRGRGLALLCLTRVRLYRCGRMLQLLAGGDGRKLAGAWRKSG